MPIEEKTRTMGHRRHLGESSSWVGTGFLLIACLALAGCDSQPSTEVRDTGGDYGPVTHDMLAGAKP